VGWDGRALDTQSHFLWARVSTNLADAGKTWQLMGLEKTGRISRIVIDPKNPDVVLIGALGHAYGPQPERGVYRTVDGGKTWERVLFTDENSGCSDIVMDPQILAFSLPECGLSRCTHGEETVVVQAVDCSNRQTVARRGNA
jgi:hypothetical protein